MNQIKVTSEQEVCINSLALQNLIVINLCVELATAKNTDAIGVKERNASRGLTCLCSNQTRLDNSRAQGHATVGVLRQKWKYTEFRMALPPDATCIISQSSVVCFS